MRRQTYWTVDRDDGKLSRSFKTYRNAIDLWVEFRINGVAAWLNRRDRNDPGYCVTLRIPSGAQTQAKLKEGGGSCYEGKRGGAEEPRRKED